MIFGYSKLYSYREKADISFEITYFEKSLIFKYAAAYRVSKASRL